MVQMPIQHHFIIPTNSTSNPRREVTVIKYCEPTKSELHAKKINYIILISKYQSNTNHDTKSGLDGHGQPLNTDSQDLQGAIGCIKCARKTDFWETTIRIWIKFDQIEKQEVNLVCSTVIRV